MSLNRLHPRYRALIYAALGLLFLSGLLWKTGLERSLLMKIHGAAAMATLVLLGALVARHVPLGWSAGTNRISGVAVLAASAWLLITGYALYYSGSDSLRYWAGETHFWVGVGVAAVFCLHLRRSVPA
jgi:hypothetical protein